MTETETGHQGGGGGGNDSGGGGGNSGGGGGGGNDSGGGGSGWGHVEIREAPRPPDRTPQPKKQG